MAFHAPHTYRLRRQLPILKRERVQAAIGVAVIHVLAAAFGVALATGHVPDAPRSNEILHVNPPAPTRTLTDAAR